MKSPVAYQGLVGRVTYNYDYRYMLEFSVGRNGSENFPPWNRYGTFPAVSAGWNITQEPFMKSMDGQQHHAEPAEAARFLRRNRERQIHGRQRPVYLRTLYVLPC